MFGAGGLWAAPVEGTITVRKINVGDVFVEEVTGKYSLDVFMGEPLENGVFKYSGTGTLHCTTQMVLTCLKPGVGTYYVFMAPSIPKSGGGFGYNTPGAPNWDRFFKRVKSLESNDYLSADEAKAFWKSKFFVSEFTLMAKSDSSSSPTPRPGNPSSRTEPENPAARPGSKGQGAEPGSRNPMVETQEEIRRLQEASRRQQEEFRRKQAEIAAQQVRDAENRAREAAAAREKQAAAAQERMNELRRQQGVAARQRQEAMDRARAQQEAAKREEKRKADALVADFDRRNRELISALDRTVQNNNKTFDQWAKNQAKAAEENDRAQEEKRLQREEKERQEEESDRREEERRAQQDEEDRAQQEQQAQQAAIEQEQAKLQVEAAKIQREAEEARLREEERLKHEEAQLIKAQDLRRQAMENSFKNDSAASLKALTAKPAAKSRNAFDDLGDSQPAANNATPSPVPPAPPNTPAKKSPFDDLSQ
jgi:hypothetical protein